MNNHSEEASSYIPGPKFAKFLFGSPRMAWLWFLLRIYVGWEWFMAGWEKLGSSAWTGSSTGAALQGFLKGALAQTAGAHPNVSGWYAAFLQNFVMSHTVLFSYLVVYGELAVGIALILGAFTGIAAFAGAFMNINYLFAGAVSTNPLLLIMELFLMLSWRVAGWWGIDRLLLPGLGVPWKPGKLIEELENAREGHAK